MCVCACGCVWEIEGGVRHTSSCKQVPRGARSSRHSPQRPGRGGGTHWPCVSPQTVRCVPAGMLMSTSAGSCFRIAWACRAQEGSGQLLCDAAWRPCRMHPCPRHDALASAAQQLCQRHRHTTSRHASQLSAHKWQLPLTCRMISKAYRRWISRSSRNACRGRQRQAEAGRWAGGQRQAGSRREREAA